MEPLLQLDFWDWLALGTVLLLLEIFGAGGYLLRTGLTAACVGALGAFLPGLASPRQVLLFAGRSARLLSTSDAPPANDSV
ncbi:NfeD family protein, partial [Pseudomonas paraeruginosa]|nr:NfeD family protein [Pseudomonas paraeruginosa]